MKKIISIAMIFIMSLLMCYLTIVPKLDEEEPIFYEIDSSDGGAYYE